MSKILNQFFYVFLIVLFLSSCGQKGPLYLPDTQHQPKQALGQTIQQDK